MTSIARVGAKHFWYNKRETPQIPIPVHPIPTYSVLSRTTPRHFTGRRSPGQIAAGFAAGAALCLGALPVQADTATSGQATVPLSQTAPASAPVTTVPPTGTGVPATPGDPNTPPAPPLTPTPAEQPVPAGTPLPPPTDVPPPDVPLPIPLRLGKRAIIGGAIDMRSLSSSYGERQSTWVREGEMNVLYPIAIRGQTRANAVLQGIVEDSGPNSHHRSISLGEGYIAYRLPSGIDSDSTAYIKVGQFQIPFGLLAVYDPHLEIIQPLYEEALGLRLDWGVGVSGRFYSLINYDFAFTAGVGPNHVGVAANRVTTLRLGRTFYTRNGVVNVGGSLLSGRLPITDPDKDHPIPEDLPASGIVTGDRGYIDKTRIGVDGTLTFKNITARGEAVTGADADQKILGIFGQGEYRFSGRTSALLARSYYQYPQGDSTDIRDSVGLLYAISPNATVRTVYEILHETPQNQPSAQYSHFTVQLLLRF